jgi:hypothetical protein
MPPRTTVSPLSTRTWVDTFLVSIEGIVPVEVPITAPTVSFFTSRSMMILSSGVMRGVTDSSSTAGLNVMVVAPLAAAVRYGISVPCEITAFFLSGRDHARARHHLSTIISFEGGQLDVHEVAAAEVEDREGERAGGAHDRQVHVELLGLARRRQGRRERLRAGRDDRERRTRARTSRARTGCSRQG